jgi:hypothetical protein
MLTKRGIWAAFRDWLVETDLYDLFLARPLAGPFGVRATRSGNLTTSSQANIKRLPRRPPPIRRGTFRSPLRLQGAVATLLVATPDRRWVCPIPLSPHPIRNRRDFKRLEFTHFLNAKVHFTLFCTKTPCGFQSDQRAEACRR